MTTPLSLSGLGGKQLPVALGDDFDTALTPFGAVATRGICRTGGGLSGSVAGLESPAILGPFPKCTEAGPQSAFRQPGFRVCEARIAAVCSIMHDQRCESDVCHILNGEAVITCKVNEEAVARQPVFDYG